MPSAALAAPPVMLATFDILALVSFARQSQLETTGSGLILQCCCSIHIRNQFSNAAATCNFAKAKRVPIPEAGAHPPQTSRKSGPTLVMPADYPFRLALRDMDVRFQPSQD
uniref:Secreted protein n=1 Tax=Trichuris muris TaxID=70415 RepID=A0A5S6QU34_TRIMR